MMAANVNQHKEMKPAYSGYKPNDEQGLLITVFLKT